MASCFFKQKKTTALRTDFLKVGNLKLTCQ